VQPQEQSTPVRISLESEPPGLPELASPERLIVAVPSLAGLEGETLYMTIGVMNLVPAPCVPCFDTQTLGVCLLSPPDGCENLTGLAERAVSMARAGTGQEALRDSLSYAEPWYPDETASSDPSRINIEVWLSPTAQGSPQIFSRIAAVQPLGNVSVHLRAMGDSAEDLRGRALSAAIAQGKAEALLSQGPVAVEEADILTQAEAAGLDMVRFRADLAAARVDVDVMRTKGVRSSPTWFVEGYRLRGLQSVESIGRLIKMESPPVTTLSLPQP
jgi:hypothetical protein